MFNDRRGCILSILKGLDITHYTIIVVSTEMHVLKYIFMQ